jgi:hypothetical protein
LRRESHHLLLLPHPLLVEVVLEGPLPDLLGRLVNLHLLSSHPLVVLSSLIEFILKLHQKLPGLAILQLLHRLLIQNQVRIDLSQPFLIFLDFFFDRGV